ncbi:hypothetical protein ZYGR_0AL01480 [Zygosaccharomyces rouxii]|uniref:Sm domain-containing protein n=1 Tax=Zygosaccharomyces rouxii TaxID=4956 RepID=A0A1Q3AF74_ZYGRO|nr:hypothetical protein ZYGR_0AL01480 [Zygosaccharomyces rouxii]
MSQVPDQASMQELKLPDFVGCTLYVNLQNDRVLKGSLMALDAQLNLLLDHVQERTGDGNQRALGLVSVPRNTIQSIKLPQAELHQLVQFKRNLLQHVV